MGLYNPPVKGNALVLRVALQSLSSAGSFLPSPPISAATFQISKDGGALANVATLPVVEPTGSIWVKISLSATEMTADVVTIQGIDTQAAKRFADFALSIPTG